MWFSGLVFNVVAGVYTLYKLRERSAAIDKQQLEGEKAVESKKLERFVKQLK
jgi:peroxin-11B